MLHAVTAVPDTDVGAAVSVRVFVDTALAQGPLPVAVSVRVTTPVSPAPAVYVAAVSEVAFAIVPVPFEDHVTPLLFVADEPAVIGIAATLLHAVIAVPATGVGAVVTLTVTKDVLFIKQDGLLVYPTLTSAYVVFVINVPVFRAADPLAPIKIV